LIQHWTGVNAAIAKLLWLIVYTIVELMLLCRGRLHDVAVEKWQIVDDEVKQYMARMASTAAWGLGLSMLCIYVTVNGCQGRLFW